MTREGDRVLEAFGRRCVPKILDILSSNCAAAKKSSALALLKDRMFRPSVKEEVLLNSGVEILVKLLSSESPEVVAHACTAVESLSESMLGREQLIQKRVIKALLGALKTAAVHSSAALARFSFHEDAKSIFSGQEADIIHSIKQCMMGDDAETATKVHLVTVAACINQTSKGLEISNMAGIPGLIATIVKDSPVQLAEVQEKLDVACASYFMTATRTSDGRAITRDSEGIRALGAHLSKGSPSTCDCATAALMTLSIDVPSKQSIVEHCLDHLLHLLANSQDGSVQSNNIKATLQNCCEDPVASRKIQETMGAVEAQRQLGPLPQFAPSF